MTAMSTLDSPELSRLRKRMLEDFVVARGIRDPLVLRAMEKVPRHLFVDEALRERAYGDYALPIGDKQTISQPYIIAQTTQALDLQGGEKILEIGTRQPSCRRSWTMSIPWRRFPNSLGGHAGSWICSGATMPPSEFWTAPTAGKKRPPLTPSW